MKVKELIDWLKTVEDKDADVLIVEHYCGTNVYEQGGYAHEVIFNPNKHSEYTDMRGNKFVPSGAPYENKRTLLLGAINQ